MITHLKQLKAKCQDNSELAQLTAKQAIALLRYTKDIRPDLAFLEAGRCAKVSMTGAIFSPEILTNIHKRMRE